MFFFFLVSKSKNVRIFQSVCMLQTEIPRRYACESLLVCAFLFQSVKRKLYACERLSMCVHVTERKPKNVCVWKPLMRECIFPDNECKYVSVWKPLSECVCYKEGPWMHACVCYRERPKCMRVNAFQCVCMLQRETAQECMDVKALKCVCVYFTDSTPKNICVWKTYVCVFLFERVNPKIYAFENLSVCPYVCWERALEFMRVITFQCVYMFQRESLRMYVWENLLECVCVFFFLTESESKNACIWKP